MSGAILTLLLVPVVYVVSSGLRQPDMTVVLQMIAVGTGAAWLVYLGLRAGVRHAVRRVSRLHEKAINELEEKDMALIKARELCETMRHMALHDPLTGLPNHALFLDRLDQAIHTADRVAVPVTVIVMDLNRFKDVNDSIGRHACDELLREIAHRLQGIMRKTDTAAHLGGDEFAFILPMTAGDKAVAFSRKILGVLLRPFQVAGHEVDIDASCGIALAPEHGTSAQTLVERATAAMRVAKVDPLGITLYNAEHDRSIPARLQKINNLRVALESGQLHLRYQPKIDLKTHALCGAEALVRWHTDENGMIPPSSFIPLTEEIGLIDALTHWVLKMAVSDAVRWRAEGIDISVSVNLSARNLHNQDLAGYIATLLESGNLAPSMLMLEITESAVMEDPAVSMDTLSKLHGMGVRLSLDDFGTGYSSLAYLKDLPLSELKIDRTFVTNMKRDSNDAIIVQSTIDLGHSLGLSVVAEGVEDQESTDLIASMGCDKLQGFYFSKPLTADEMVEWIKKSDVLSRFSGKFRHEAIASH